MPNGTGFTPTFSAGDLSAVATDIIVGTGVGLLKFAPLVSLVIVSRAVAPKRTKGTLRRLLGIR